MKPKPFIRTYALRRQGHILQFGRHPSEGNASEVWGAAWEQASLPSGTAQMTGTEAEPQGSRSRCLPNVPPALGPHPSLTCSRHDFHFQHVFPPWMEKKGEACRWSPRPRGPSTLLPPLGCSASGPGGRPACWGQSSPRPQWAGVGLMPLPSSTCTLRRACKGWGCRAQKTRVIRAAHFPPEVTAAARPTWWHWAPAVCQDPLLPRVARRHQGHRCGRRNRAESWIWAKDAILLLNQWENYKKGNIGFGARQPC